MTAYKAYKVKKDENGNEILYCQNQEYKEGETYEMEGLPVCCQKGYHACENPLDVLNYYDLCGSAFTEVEAVGEVHKRDDEDSKFATNKIKIGARLDLKGFIQASFQFLWERCKKGEAVSSERNSKLAASGYYSQLAASGYYSQLAASGDNSQLAASGHYSKLAASGHYSKLAASGDSSKLEMTGEDSVGAAIGIDGIAKGKTGCWITLAEWKYNYEKSRYVPVCVKSAQIDGKKLKADIFYKLINGEFVEQ